MTDRLYYTNSYQTEFEARVVESVTADRQLAVILDESCFYPTSGGQPFDTGRLDGQTVIDVRIENGRVVHLLENGSHNLTPGQTVQGQIDWPRRFDHMQQHSGQHLLSYVFDELWGYETVSVHFGAEESTLDLATAELTPLQMCEAEQLANQLIYENLPITAYVVDEAAIGRLPLRRPPKVSGQIRIVEIDKRDYSACGGTHCHHTGELGSIRLTRQERSRGNTRVTFLCGGRALRDAVHKHELVTQVAALFSTDLDSAPELVQRVIEQNGILERQVNELQQQLMHYKALDLLHTATQVAEIQLVTSVLEGYTPENVRVVAARLQEETQLIACLAAVTNNKLTLFCARSADVTVHMGNLLREALGHFGGGGGGRPDFAQGGGVDPVHAEELMVYLKTQLQAHVMADSSS